ncbi:glycosyltransferase [Liquorilactobacillus uvarum]|uniref:Glycosyltransferase n=1 Tax=Liquorilactobacillus uvarum DSM 19971 TaxID=1423812 RepID=A0A0R1PVN1_9LACO|nr:glycosyltransferase [Liquorilactobacillus uvarum]KRL36672.1 glycosyltransferase [Liquorilactobacillus uvarum DSM 19971]
MKILHYSLGFPPSRTGGLVTYAIDLAHEQAKNGDMIYYLYPGKINFLKKRAYIKKDSANSYGNFQAFSLINSLPLPLFGGIREPNDFMANANKDCYFNLLKTIKPDVIHIHTLMGLHKEFFEVAAFFKIKIVYTSHDYFGLAPEPNFFYNGSNYVDDNSIKKWIEISKTALPTWKLRIFQFNSYKTIKPFLKKISKLKGVKNKKFTKDINYSNEKLRKFTLLRNYYLSIFGYFDFYHFNSTVSANVYNKFINIDKSEIISISNAGIIKNSFKLKEKNNSGKLRVGYIGPYEKYKGFFEFLKLTHMTGKKVEYHVFGSNEKIKIPSKIINHGRYSRKNIKKVFELIDVLIVPSLWNETFGFITAEALSYGVKVLTSNHVGSKDIIDRSFIFENINQVPKLLLNLNKYRLIRPKTINEHYVEIKKMYKKGN